jgi:CDP-6-deoxy-D-xylo-4-hexulose-3-dehydrase
LSSTVSPRFSKDNERLPAFIAARKRNWEILRVGLPDLSEYLEFMLPTHAVERKSQVSIFKGQASEFVWDDTGCRSDPSWFGFMLLVRPTAPFSRTELARHLDAKKIGNRMLFGGNLVRQPTFVQLRRERPGAFRVAGDLAGADRLMREALFVGTYPGLSQPMLDYEITAIRDFVRQHGGH